MVKIYATWDTIQLKLWYLIRRSDVSISFFTQTRTQTYTQWLSLARPLTRSLHSPPLLLSFTLSTSILDSGARWDTSLILFPLSHSVHRPPPRFLITHVYIYIEIKIKIKNKFEYTDWFLDSFISEAYAQDHTSLFIPLCLLKHLMFSFLLNT